MKFDFKNYRTMSVEDINAYISDLTKEYEKTKSEINKKCEWLEELDGEYLDCQEELKNRKNG